MARFVKTQANWYNTARQQPQRPATVRSRCKKENVPRVATASVIIVTVTPLPVCNYHRQNRCLTDPTTGWKILCPILHKVAMKPN